MPKLPSRIFSFLSKRWSLYGLAAAAVIACSLIPRLDQLGRGQSIAEAWVANSVLAGSMREMLYYDHWLQTSPPLFLMLVRFTVKILGASDVVLRAVPFTLGILAIAMLARLAGKMLRPAFALLCTCLIAFSPYGIAYSKELKQYSSDMFATCLVLWAIWTYIQSPTRRQYFVLLFVFAVTLFLSYTAIVFVPLAVLVVLLETRPAASRGAGLAAFTGILGGINYFCFVRPNSSSTLTTFWAVGFPPAGWKNTFRFYLEHFAPMPFYFYFTAGTGVQDTLRARIEALPGIIQAAAAIAALSAVALGVCSLRRRRSERYGLLFFIVPLLTLAAMNRDGLYPVSSRRLTLFMLPCVVLASAAILQSLWLYLRERWIQLAPPLSPAMRICGIAALLLGIAALSIHPGVWDIDTSDDGGMESVVRYLKAKVRPGYDLVYVHDWEEEPARLYLAITGWKNAPVRFGHTGYPCCKRTAEKRPGDSDTERDYVFNDFRNAIGQPPNGDLWLVLPDPRPEWGPAATDDPRIITSGMYGLGCSEEREKHFDSVNVYEFHCDGRRANRFVTIQRTTAPNRRQRRD